MLAALLAAAALVACGGGGQGQPANPVVQGAVVKGPVAGATVCAFELADGAKGAQIPLAAMQGAAGTMAGGCYVTPADGSYQVRLDMDADGDVLLESTGGQFCAGEEPVAAGLCAGGAAPLSLDGAVMRTVVHAQVDASATVYTTPLTTAAVASSGAGLSAGTFATQFATLAGQVIGPASGITPASAPTAASQPYLAQAASFLAGGGTLASAVSSLAQGTTTFTAASGTPATVNAAVVGTHDLVFKAGGAPGCAGTGCTFTEGQAVTVIVHGDSRLELPGGKILTSPFYRSYGSTMNQHEIIWYDAAAKIEYALSDNQGTFREINVGDMATPTGSGLPRFLGQLHAPTNDTLSALTAHEGTYAKAFQYAGADVGWTSVTIGADGSIAFVGGSGPDVAPADIVQVFDRVGCCGRVDVTINRDLNTPPNGIDGGDKISLHLDENGVVRSIGYDLGNEFNMADDTGVRLGTAAALTFDGTAVPATPAVNGTVDGTALDFAMHPAASVNTLGMTLHAQGGDTGPSWVIQIGTGSLQVGSYSCRVSSAGTVLVQATLAPGGFPVSTRNGGRCTINITRMESAGTDVTLLEGNFVAEMFDGGSQDMAPRVVTNGVFRWTP